MNTWKKRGSETTIKEVFLRNIGKESLDDINGWFTKSYSEEYRIDKLDDAVMLAKSFIDKPVRIIGDYDADGVTSTSILYLALKRAGFKNVSYRIPKRFSEGFGINNTIIDEVNDGLIITCDNGVAQLEAIQKAKDKGLNVIIIDHHEPVVADGEIVLPNADIIIDPNAIKDSADFNGYCGAGLSYRFARRLLGEDSYIKKLLGLAAIGTVADVMELREENYVFVRNGLKALKNPQATTSGTYALISSLDLTRYISSHDIGFKVGPVINASSRMKDDGAMDAVKLLTFDGPFPYAIGEAEKLIERNEQRKVAKKEALKIAIDTINNEMLMCDVPLIVTLEGVPEGVIGIIAGNLCEEYKVPAIVLTTTSEGILKGSSRSCGNYNIKEELDKVSSLLLKYGGHEGAAGLSLDPKNLDEFRRIMQENAKSFTPPEEADTIFYDLEIKASDIADTIQELEKYGPFGNGNDYPVFKISDYSVNPKGGFYVNKVASEYDITKLFYKSDVCAIGFDLSKRFKNVTPKSVNLVGTLSDNYFNGKITHQVEFNDFSLNAVNQITTPLAEKLKRMALATSTT